MNLKAIVNKVDAYLDTKKIKDYPGSFNGLQIENNGIVTKVAAAVDADIEAIQQAASLGVDLLVVHHGLFWNNKRELTGPEYKKIKLLMDNNIAVYSSHLPLDRHPIIGNNATIAQIICEKCNIDRSLIQFYEDFCVVEGEFPSTMIVADYFNKDVFKIMNTIAAAPFDVDYEQRWTDVLTRFAIEREPRLMTNTTSKRRIAICTGNGGSVLQSAINAGCDMFITGEMAQHNYSVVKEHEISVILLGHYESEIYGVKRLAEDISIQHDLVNVGLIRTNCNL